MQLTLQALCPTSSSLIRPALASCDFAGIRLLNAESERPASSTMSTTTRRRAARCVIRPSAQDFNSIPLRHQDGAKKTLQSDIDLALKRKKGEQRWKRHLSISLTTWLHEKGAPGGSHALAEMSTTSKTLFTRSYSVVPELLRSKPPEC